MREPGETASEENKCATQEKYEQKEDAGAASPLDETGTQRVIVDLWQLLLGHVGLGAVPLGVYGKRT
jgi:hypothetical protein